KLPVVGPARPSQPGADALDIGDPASVLFAIEYDIEPSMADQNVIAVKRKLIVFGFVDGLRDSGGGGPRREIGRKQLNNRLAQRATPAVHDRRPDSGRVRRFFLLELPVAFRSTGLDPDGEGR